MVPRRVTNIDPQADIELDLAGEEVTAKIPLDGPVTSEWRRCYQKIAFTAQVPAKAEALDGRAWLVVSVPASSGQAEVLATMDGARALIAEADAAADRLVATEAEASVRDWWARSRGSIPGRPVSRVQAEKRWPMAFALVLAMAVPLLLPARFSLGPRWAVPAIEALLLVMIIAGDRGRIDRRSTLGRALSVILVAVLVVEAAGVTGRLVTDLIEGGPETNSPAALLKIGFLVWFYTIIAFAFLYWTTDGDGPEARFLTPPEFPDLAFPEQLNPQVAAPSWRPEFFDYLYLAFTNATAFSPTDVMPLARWAKLAMTVQALCSIMILGLVIARAVNILK
jgi:uncharacterized membrane protein